MARANYVSNGSGGRFLRAREGASGQVGLGVHDCEGRVELDNSPPPSNQACCGVPIVWAQIGLREVCAEQRFSAHQTAMADGTGQSSMIHDAR